MVIGHFQGLWEKSGVATLVGALIRKQRDLGHTVHYLDYAATRPFVGENDFLDPYTLVQDDRDLYDVAEALKLDIIHAHHDVGVLPTGRIPLVRTVHHQGPHCPSTLHYLKRRHQLCHRNYDLMGCVWGHIVEGCGRHRNPRNWYADFQKTWNDRRVLPHIRSMTVSRFVKREMVRAGYPESMVDVVPIFVPGEIKPYVPPPETGTPHILFIGRIVPEKGLQWLLEAISRITVPFHLDIAGDGPHLEPMRQYADELRISDRLTFHGWANPDQREYLMCVARAVVIPSICEEASGTVAVEAAAAGRAIIASKVGGLPEYAVHQENAIVVESENTEVLAQALSNLLIDSEKARFLGCRGYSMALNNFTLDHYLDKTINIYRQVIHEHSPDTSPSGQNCLMSGVNGTSRTIQYQNAPLSEDI